MIQALLLGLISGFGILDGRLFGVMMFDRPLFTGLLVGIVLGDIKQGIIIGAQLELVWMGLASIGGATPPDIVTGGVLGTAFAILSGKGVAVALALAVPIALLAQSIGIGLRILNSIFVNKAEKYADEANFKGIAFCLWTPIILFFLSTFIPTFLAVLIGSSQISTIVNAIPDVILKGLQVAGGLLPAVGFALLMDMLITKKAAPFFFLGFIAASYLKLDITAVALFATCIALVIHFFIDNNHSGSDKNESADHLTEGEIDFE